MEQGFLFFAMNKENPEHFSKRWGTIVILTAGSPQVAPSRINPNTLIAPEPKISPCGRDDRIDKPVYTKRKML